MKDLIDLHVHSNCSDGTLTPAELVDLAIKKKLKAFALTDHDTTAGIDSAAQAILDADSNLELIPGIELSTNYLNKDIHIVGLGIDKDNVYFQETLSRFQNSRYIRNQKMIKKLQEHGIDITEEKMFASFGDAVWTRAHFGRFIQDAGYVSNLWDAFPKYIGDNAPCFVPREKVTPFQGIQLIHEGGGVAVLAHPLLYPLTAVELDTLVGKLAKAGLDAIEVHYSMNRYGDENRVKLLAKKYGLKPSGGSDFHGSNKPSIQLGTGKGNINMSYDIWKALSAGN